MNDFQRSPRLARWQRALRERDVRAVVAAGRMLLASLWLPGCWLQASAQAGPAVLVRVSGTVRDAATQQGLPGVAVQLRRTRQRTVTNAQGGFVLAAGPADTLLVQALGYKPYRLLLPGPGLAQLVVQVRLPRDSVRLGEVRVMADRADRPAINRALRNLNRPAPPLLKGPQRPHPKPLFAVDSTPPPPPPPGGTPLD